MDTYSAIRQAVLDCSQVAAAHKGCVRELRPYVLGRNSGRRQALYLRFAGGSNSGLSAGGVWRRIPVDQIGNVEVRSVEWHTGTGHSREQACVDFEVSC